MSVDCSITSKHLIISKCPYFRWTPVTEKVVFCTMQTLFPLQNNEAYWKKGLAICESMLTVGANINKHWGEKLALPFFYQIL